MGKRVGLFLLTNIAIMVALSIVWAIVQALSGGRLAPGSLISLAVFSLVWGMGGAFISLQISRWIAKRSMGVQLIDGRSGDPMLDNLHATVIGLAQRAGLPAAPEVGVYQSDEVNAFATGPSKSRSLVAVSTGLLRRMTPAEVEGVLAHEISHVANGDMVTMTLIQGVVNAFVLFASRLIAQVVRQYVDQKLAWVVSFAVMIACQIAFGFLGMIIVSWFSRHREFRADAGSANLAGRASMIAALRRLQGTNTLVDTSQPALAAFKISGARGGLLALVSTHPPLEVRIARLEAA